MSKPVGTAPGGPALNVVLNGWFAGHRAGSGQYTDALLAALRSAAPSGHTYRLAAPAGGRGTTRKLAWEQALFPRASRGADVAHVPYWAPPLFPTAPTVVTIHDLAPLVLPDYRRDWRLRAYSGLAARASRRAAAVVADSDYTARTCIERLSIDPRRVRRVYLGVEPRFRSGARADDLAGRLGLPKRYGLYLGGFDPRKNVAMLLAAWRGVHRATGVPLVVAGEQPSPTDEWRLNATRAAAQLGLPASALLAIGEVAETDKPALYAGAAVFAYPSRYEGFGLPPLEAMACGTPTVVADATSLPEVVADAAIALPADDERAWSEGLVTVLTDDALSTRLRGAGPRRAAQFTWDETAARTRAVYERIARTRPHG